MQVRSVDGTARTIGSGAPPTLLTGLMHGAESPSCARVLTSGHGQMRRSDQAGEGGRQAKGQLGPGVRIPRQKRLSKSVGHGDRLNRHVARAALTFAQHLPPLAKVGPGRAEGRKRKRVF